MPEMIMMIGLPGSGKTTYRMQHYPDYVCISHDDHVEAYAKEHGMTYNDAYPHVNSYRATQEALARAFENGDNIIVDFVAATPKFRKGFISEAKERGYKITAIHFSLTDTERARRVAMRKETTGKVISEEIVESMARKFVTPTKTEGFDRIVTVRN